MRWSNRCYLTALPLLFGWAGGAHAQLVPRSWVAVSGSDSSSFCNFASPCQSLQRAHNVTISGGEIIILDSGFYDFVNVSKSITIRGAENPTVSNISTQAGADKVVLDHLNFNGKFQNNTGSVGNLTEGLVVFQGTELLVNDCRFYRYTNAIRSAGLGTLRVTITNSEISQNDVGISSTNANGGVRHWKLFNTRIIGAIAAGERLIGATSDVLLSGSTIIGAPKALDLPNGAVARSYGNNVLTNGDVPVVVPLN